MPTDEEITVIETSIASSIESGVTSISTDGLSTSFADAESRLDALERLERRTNRAASAVKPHFGLRFTKLIPPSCG